MLVSAFSYDTHVLVSAFSYDTHVLVSAFSYDTHLLVSALSYDTHVLVSAFSYSLISYLDRTESELNGTAVDRTAMCVSALVTRSYPQLYHSVKSRTQKQEWHSCG